MISYRQADLLDTLKRSQPTKMLVKFRFEDHKLQLTNITPEDNSYNDEFIEKRDALEEIVHRATMVMGFYKESLTDAWTYNTNIGNQLSTVMEVRRRLESCGDPRIVSVRDSIAENINKDRFVIEVMIR